MINSLNKFYFKTMGLRDKAINSIKSNKGMALVEYITIGVLILIILIGVIAAFKVPLKAIADKIVAMLTGASGSSY